MDDVGVDEHDGDAEADTISIDGASANEYLATLSCTVIRRRFPLRTPSPGAHAGRRPSLPSRPEVLVQGVRERTHLGLHLVGAPEEVLAYVAHREDAQRMIARLATMSALPFAWYVTQTRKRARR